MDQSAVFLAGSVLTMMGLVTIVIGIVVINNLIHKFWKPITIFTKDSFTLFGMHHDHTDPMNNLTQEEYEHLSKYLKKIREGADKNADDKRTNG